jgi:hypothetical protein
MNVAEPHPAKELIATIPQQPAGGGIGVDDSIAPRVDGENGIGDLA